MFKTRVPLLVLEYERKHQRRPTQAEIAEAVDMRRPTVSAWMQWGATFKRLDADVVGAFARFFNVSPTEVFEWVDIDDDEHMLAVA